MRLVSFGVSLTNSSGPSAWGAAFVNAGGTQHRHKLRNVADVSWFRVSAGRLEYRGRITRDPFTRWCATQEGVDAVARTARGIRFSLVGRSRAATRRLWRQLDTAVRSDALAHAIRLEAAQYLTHPAGLSYSLSLPRAHVALHRLVMIPRALAIGRARAALHARLRQSPALAACDAAARAFFLEQLVLEMAAALEQAAPSPRYPVQAHEQWACVGVAREMVWIDRFWSGSDATGHLFMYEFPREGIGRRERKALEAAIEELHAQVAPLPQGQRSEMLRLAADQ